MVVGHFFFWLLIFPKKKIRPYPGARPRATALQTPRDRARLLGTPKVCNLKWRQTWVVQCFKYQMEPAGPAQTRRDVEMTRTYIKINTTKFAYEDIFKENKKQIAQCGNKGFF